jgi:hypothetical protein
LISVQNFGKRRLRVLHAGHLAHPDPIEIRAQAALGVVSAASSGEIPSMEPNPPACALCEQQRILVESHIFPAFLFRWKKKTAATTYLRCNEDPKKRVQDGLKVPMLCAECEGLFNKFETDFCNHVFHPLVSGKTSSASYGPWLLKFCVSVSWRILAHASRADGEGVPAPGGHY